MSVQLEMTDGTIVTLYDEEEVQGFIEDFSDHFDAVHWLSDEDYSKALGQFRLQLGTLVGEMLEPLKMYGQQPFVENAVEEIVKIGSKLTEDFGLRVRGINNVISLEIIKQKEKEKENRQIVMNLKLEG